MADYNFVKLTDHKGDPVFIRREAVHAVMISEYAQNCKTAVYLFGDPESSYDVLEEIEEVMKLINKEN